MPVWLSWLSTGLLTVAHIMISGSSDPVPHQALHWAWSLFGVLCPSPTALPPSPGSLSLSLSLPKKKNKKRKWSSCPIWLSKRALRFLTLQLPVSRVVFFFLTEPWLQCHSNHKSTDPYFTIRHYWSTWINNLSAASSSDMPCLLHLYHDPSPNEPLCKPQRFILLLPAPQQYSTRNVTKGNGKSNT